MKTTLNLAHIFLLTAGIAGFAGRATAQVKPGERKISGAVADSVTRQAIEFVTLSLMTSDNKVLKADYSKIDGSFAFTGLAPSRYSVVLTAVGYTPKTLAVDLTDTTKNSADLGTVYFSTQTVGLQEVVVTASRPIVSQEIDRISYNLQADPDSKAYSVLEMMRKVPFLSLDAQNNILLKGNGSYRIFINGKPSSMVERNPKEVLQSMPASTIERIEVITNPPSKYEAEGLTGIINIITNKKLENGYEGSVNINERFPVGGPGLGGSFSAKIGKFGMTAIGGASMNNTPQTRNSTNRMTTGADPTMLIQNGNNASDRSTAYLGYELSYEIDSLHLISGGFNLNGSRSKDYNNQSTSFMAGDQMLQGYTLANGNAGFGRGADASLNYQMGFRASKDRLLTFSYRYYTFSDNNDGNVIFSDRENYDLPDYNQANDQNFAEHSFQVDYVHRIKKLNIETGVKGIMRDNKSDFRYSTFNSESEEFEFMPGFSNKFNNDQNVLGAYNTYQYSLKDWGIKAGVRVEQTIIDADFISSDARVQQNYLNVIPSVAVNKKFKNNSSLNFGFMQRIKRPSIQKLNPFVDRSNPNFETTGNPNLRPVISNRFQLAYGISKKTSVNVGLDYTFMNNLDLKVTSFDPATNISRTTYQNTGRASAIDNTYSIKYPVTKRWDVSLNGTVSYIRMEGFVDNALLKTEWLQYALSSSTGYRLDKGWRLQASFNVVSASINSLQGKTNALIGSAFGVNKDIIADKLSLSVLVNNPFTKYRKNVIETEGPNFVQVNNSWNYFRSYNFSLNYRFGKLKGDIKKSKRGIKNDDI